MPYSESFYQVRLLASLAVIVALGCACSPWWRVNGRVVEAPEAALAAVPVMDSRNQPALSGVRVHMSCPDYDENVEAESNPDGTFRLTGWMFMNDSCLLEVQHPGYTTRHYHLEDICTDDDWERGQECHVGHIRVELIPER